MTRMHGNWCGFRYHLRVTVLWQRFQLKMQPRLVTEDTVSGDSCLPKLQCNSRSRRPTLQACGRGARRRDRGFRSALPLHQLSGRWTSPLPRVALPAGGGFASKRRYRAGGVAPASAGLKIHASKAAEQAVKCAMTSAAAAAEPRRSRDGRRNLPRQHPRRRRPLAVAGR
jgi:hypothetical protein